MIKYTITELSNILGQNRVNVMRLIDRLELREMNPDRPYKNSPKYYNESVYKALRKEYGLDKVKQKYSEENNKSNTNSIESRDEIINLLKEQNKVLKEQLENSNKSRENLEKLLDQQQRLALVFNDSKKTIEEESDKVESAVPHKKFENKKGLFFDFFKRKK